MWCAGVRVCMHACLCGAGRVLWDRLGEAGSPGGLWHEPRVGGTVALACPWTSTDGRAHLPQPRPPLRLLLGVELEGESS